MQQTTIHLGNTLKTYLDSKKIAKAQLARKMLRTPRRILQYEKQTSLQFSILLEITHALKHNFFADIAALLPEGYTTSVQPDTTHRQHIEALEREVEILKAEKQVLLEAMKK